MYAKEQEQEKFTTNASDVSTLRPPSGELLEEIKGTPFHVLTTETGKHILLGRYRLNKEEIPLTESPKEWLEENMWNVILIISIISQTSKK